MNQLRWNCHELCRGHCTAHTRALRSLLDVSYGEDSRPARTFCFFVKVRAFMTQRWKSRAAYSDEGGRSPRGTSLALINYSTGSKHTSLHVTNTIIAGVAVLGICGDVPCSPSLRSLLLLTLGQGQFVGPQATPLGTSCGSIGTGKVLQLASTHPNNTKQPPTNHTTHRQA